MIQTVMQMPNCPTGTKRQLVRSLLIGCCILAYRACDRSQVHMRLICICQLYIRSGRLWTSEYAQLVVFLIGARHSPGWRGGGAGDRQ